LPMAPLPPAPSSPPASAVAVLQVCKIASQRCQYAAPLNIPYPMVSFLLQEAEKWCKTGSEICAQGGTRHASPGVLPRVALDAQAQEGAACTPGYHVGQLGCCRDRQK
jgi:hypothetical protein